MRTAVVLIFAALLPVLPPVQAQDKKESAEPAVYKVEFNIRDGSDAAAKSGRRYSMLVDASGKGRFQVGDKVPYATGSFQPGAGAVGVSPQIAMQYTYLDTGVNLECRVRDLNGKISLTADIDISTITQHARDSASPPNPTVAAIRISGVNALMELGKPVLIASMDDPVTTRKFDIEATVTKLR